jgi:hypothetical protein
MGDFSWSGRATFVLRRLVCVQIKTTAQTTEARVELTRRGEKYWYVLVGQRACLVSGGFARTSKQENDLAYNQLYNCS